MMSRIYRFRWHAFLWFPLLSTFTGFSQIQVNDDLRRTFSFEDPKFSSLIVASVDNRKITAQEFLFNYEFGPAFTRREKDSRRRYLNFMIYEKLLALEGYARHLDTTEGARQTLAEIEGDLATEELYKDDVRGKVKITEEEIDYGIRKAQINLTVKWLYARSAEEARRLYEKFIGGIAFDSLFETQLGDSVKAEDRSIETTRFKLEMANPVLAHVLDTLCDGTVSSPINAPNGYYIVKVVDSRKNLLMTESENSQIHSDVERALVQQKSDSLSDLYLQKIMTREHPTIIRKPFDLLQTYLAKIIISPQEFSNWKLAERLLERWGQFDFMNIAPYEKQKLIELSRHTYTVKDYLVWYRAREYNIRLDISSPQAFFISFEQTVWRMVRDKLLTERAINRGLQKRNNVKKQMQWWMDKVVYKLVRGGIVDSIQLNDSLLNKYHAEHQRSYRNLKGDMISFERAKDDVLRDFYSDELTKRLLHRILMLKEKYKVNMHDEELMTLPIDDDFNPRAIDVYAVKKGGTFPRPAFPSIDYEWQTWN